MTRRKRSAPAVVITLVVAMLFAPFTYAEQSIETIPVAAAATSPANPEPAPPDVAVTSEQSSEALPVTLRAGWWKTPAISDPRVGLGQSYRFQVDPAVAAPPPAEPRKGGKTLIIIGGAVAVTGGVMAVAGSNGDEIGDSGVAINWRTTGLIWIGIGATLAIIGLIKR